MGQLVFDKTVGNHTWQGALPILIKFARRNSQLAVVG